MLVMAALMLAMVVPAFAAPNPDSAAGRCGPPGQTIRTVTPNPTEEFLGAPGQAVSEFCAPGQQL
jgi:hypothetical protein